MSSRTGNLPVTSDIPSGIVWAGPASLGCLWRGLSYGDHRGRAAGPGTGASRLLAALSKLGELMGKEKQGEVFGIALLGLPEQTCCFGIKVALNSPISLPRRGYGMSRHRRFIPDRAPWWVLSCLCWLGPCMPTRPADLGIPKGRKGIISGCSGNPRGAGDALGWGARKGTAPAPRVCS